METCLDAIGQPHVQFLLRLVLGGLLLLAGVSKLAGRAAFRSAVADYGVLPIRLERPFAALVPLMETALGGLLLLGFGTRAAAALAAPLFLSFAIAIAVNVWRGRQFECHCFGATQREEIGLAALLRSIVLALASLSVAIGASRFGSLEAAVFGSSGPPPESEAVPVVFLAAVVFDILFLLPQTVAFRQTFHRARVSHHHEEARSA